MELNPEQLAQILHMYPPSARYISKVEINFPKSLEAKLTFPETPIHLVEDTSIKHINNTEVEIIINQVAWLFYREAFLQGALGLPKLSEKELGKYYDGMFIKRKSDNYQGFVDRKRDDLSATLEHVNTRKIRKVYFVFFNLSIPRFYTSKGVIVGGVRINDN